MLFIMQIFSLFRPLAITLLLYLASYLMMMGSGFFPEPLLFDTTLFTLCLLFVIGSKKSFAFLLIPLVACYAFYTPIGLTFGPPSYQYVASVFATDVQESKEFFTQIPPLHYLAGIAIILLIFFARFLAKQGNLQFHRNRTFVAGSMILLFSAIVPFKFINEGTNAIIQVKNELEKLNSLSIQSEWGHSQLENSRYDDYVLIIGESARKDYHHAYGYPTPNTPFMSSANGTLVDGLTAGGTNTIASLKLMLTKPNTEKWEGNYALSLIDLIKSAGIKTIWLSNQGYLGTYDTPISSIANKSDEKLFLKAGDSLNENVSDLEILPRFETIITQPYQGKRFIVVHLYGSHPIACERVNDYPKIFDDKQLDKKYHSLNCYVSSIKKTDEIIEKIYQQLLKNQQLSQRSFSMIYFSDHGLAHKVTEQEITLQNNSGSKLHFNIPLFKISSDDTKRTEHHVFKSGLNFTDGIAKWVGITNPKLNKSADLFNNQPDPDDYGLKHIIERIKSQVDPAIAIQQ